MLHLPPTVVPYLNALSHKGTDHREELETFLEALQQFEHWLAFESGYSIDAAEAGQFENMALLLAEVRRVSLEVPGKQAQLDQLVPRLYELVGLMESVNQRRAQPRYSAQPAVNDFLMCGAAWLQGSASPEALLQRLQRLEAYYGVLRHAFKGNRGRLKSEVAEALEQGLNHLQAAMAGVADPLPADRDGLQDNLAAIAEGAEIMQHLIDWQRADQLRFTQTQQRYQIPLAGPALQATLEQGRELPRAQWARGVRNLQEQVLPQLEQFWEHFQRRFFADPTVRAEVVAGVDQALEQLQLAIEGLLAPDRETGQAVAGFEQALEQLSAAFEVCREHALPHQHLRGTQAGEYIEAILGALSGTVPFLAFPELFHCSPPPLEWKSIVDSILAFGDDLDPEHLLHAGYLLLRIHPAPAEQAEHPDNWECVYCGHSNRVGQRTCAVCSSGSAAVEASAGWDG